MSNSKVSRIWAISAAAILLLGACEAKVSVSGDDEGEAAAAPSLALENAGNGVRAHMEFLADDLLEGRYPGTRGYDIGARYVASYYEAIGLKPAGDDGSYYQNVPLRETNRDNDAAVVELRRGGETRTLESLTDYVINANARLADSSITAPVVFVGYGVEAPTFGVNDYEGVDVNGKIVMALLGAPNNLPGEERAHYGNSNTKARTAADHGAIGMVYVHSLTMEKIFPYERIAARTDLSSMTWIDKAGDPHVAAPELRAGALLSAAVAREMFEGAERSFDEVREEAETEGGDPGAIELPVQLSIHQESRHGDIISPNIAGLLEGSDPALKDEYVVLTAHLDHDGVRGEGEGDHIFNGALDNASGTATIMEVARALAESPEPPRRSIVFVAVTGEERGLLGAEYYAYYPTVPKQQIVANINIDGGMFFYDFADVLAFGHSHTSLDDNLHRVTEAMGLGIGEDPMPEQGFFVRSDHYRFVQQGIPAIFPWVGLTSAEEGVDGRQVFANYLQNDYHHPSDDMNLPWDWDAAAKFVTFVTRLTVDVANQDERPYWKEGDFFGNLFAGGGEEQADAAQSSP